jgi:hypothetical protein
MEMVYDNVSMKTERKETPWADFDFKSLRS